RLEGNIVEVIGRRFGRRRQRLLWHEGRFAGSASQDEMDSREVEEEKPCKIRVVVVVLLEVVVMTDGEVIRNVEQIALVLRNEVHFCFSPMKLQDVDQVPNGLLAFWPCRSPQLEYPCRVRDLVSIGLVRLRWQLRL